MRDTANTEEWVFLRVMDSNYWELAIKINPVCADIVCEIIDSNFNCEGIVTAEEKYKDLELISTTDDVVKAYIVSEKIDLDEIKTFFALKRQEISDLNIFNEDIGSWEVSIAKQEIVDWSKKWKEHWKPSKISNHIVICPSWESYEKQEDEIVITLDPGNAFGTGTHATTQLCVEATEKYMKKGDCVADIGCGSGILAICAMKLGALKSTAIDNDPIAVNTAIENAKINSVDIKFATQTVDMLEADNYDFVLANILHNVLAEIMPDLKRIMKKGAKLLLSGILEEKEAVVLEAVMCNNLKVIEKTKKNEWVAFTVKRED